MSVCPYRLLGICADKDPVYIVMEFMPGGTLLDYLRKKGCQQTKKKLCSMCVDVSRVSGLVVVVMVVGGGVVSLGDVFYPSLTIIIS